MRDGGILVTCVILTYNKFSEIEDTIQSVLNQTYPAIELIISDDASDNMPKAEIENYISIHRKENIKKYVVIQHTENVGTVKNANNAIRLATGKYIFPLAGDDCFYSDSVIEKVVQTMEQRQWNHILCRRMTCTDFQTETGLRPSEREIRKIKKLNTAYKQKMALISNKSYHLATGAGFFYSKDLFDKLGGYDEQYRLLEDLPLFYKMVKENIALNTCYDIIAILYQLGGVSTTKCRSTALDFDIATFYKAIWEQDNQDFPRKVKRLVYVVYMIKCEFPNMKLLEKIVFILRYLDIFVEKAVCKVFGSHSAF